jgi:hypothetical protein
LPSVLLDPLFKGLDRKQNHPTALLEPMQTFFEIPSHHEKAHLALRDAKELRRLSGTDKKGYRTFGSSGRSHASYHDKSPRAIFRRDEKWAADTDQSGQDNGSAIPSTREKIFVKPMCSRNYGLMGDLCCSSSTSLACIFLKFFCHRGPSHTPKMGRARPKETRVDPELRFLKNLNPKINLTFITGISIK